MKRLTRKTSGLMALHLLLLMAVGCAPRHQDQGAPAEPSPTDDPPVATETTRPRAPREPSRSPEVVYREAWPRLFLSAQTLPPGEVAVETGGLAATHREIPLLESAAVGGNPLSARETLLVLQYLTTSGLDKDADFEARVRGNLRRVLAESVIEEIAAREAAQLTEEDLRAEYERRLEGFTQPPRVSVRLILVSTESEANSIVERARGSEEFGALASEFSLHSSRTSAGRIAPFSRGTYNVELEDVAFALKPGELGIAPSPRGYFVVQKIADAEASVIPFDQVREELYRELRSRKAEEARRAFLDWLETRIDDPDEQRLAIPAM